MPRIKVTGYINTDDLDADMVDLNNSTGLSTLGFEELQGMHDVNTALPISSLEDLEFELQEQSPIVGAPRTRKKSD